MSLFRVMFGWVLLCGLLSSAVTAREEIPPEESDFPPGLLARYEADGVTIERLDPDVSFDWQTGSPDVRLPAGPFSATWGGLFLVKGQGPHRFHAYLSGDLTLLLDGEVVLKAEASEPQWVSGEQVPLTFGEKEIEVRYEKTNELATVKLFWSSDKFAIEPIATQNLYRFEGRPDLAELEKGRTHFRAFHCDRCHEKNDTLQSSPGPSLEHANVGLSSEWIVEKLTNEPEAHAKMPRLGISEEEAADIAAYLLQAEGKSPKLTSVKNKDRKKEAASGELLVRSTGCLACHVMGELGTSGPFGGGTLDDVGEKRTAEWIATWLKNPASLNSDHRMPEVPLKSSEIRDIATFLTGDGKKDESTKKADEAQVARGKALIGEFGCASCHEIPGIKEAESGFVAIPDDSTLEGCLRKPGESAKKKQPWFPQADVEAIRAWLKSYQNASEVNPHFSEMAFQRGANLLVENNCTACHERDRAAGMVAVAGDVAKADSRLNGKSQGMIPPHLTAVGDRIQTDSLLKGIHGELPTRLPWLSVRMPKFDHSKRDAGQIMAYLIGHDRLPEPIPDDRLQIAENELTRAEELLVSRELVGGRAFNCIACHKFGDYEPLNTELATRGSDLLGISQRLRPAYFLRWTAAPLRIVPGVEMPNYDRPKMGFPVKTTHEQLSLLWKGVNHPEFEAPSDPAVVEQYLVVQPGERPQVVRDVFERAETKERTFLARPMAVGFDNGHSLLFDLDSASLREWTYGDFSYQKTEGKSWFWYMAGAPVVKKMIQPSDFALRKAGAENGSLIPPVKEEFRSAELKDYQVQSDSMRMRYVIHFEIDGEPVDVTMRERWRPLADDGRTGIRREMEASNVPAGYEMVLQQVIEPTSVAKPRIVMANETVELTSKGVEIPFPEASGKTQALKADYVTSLKDRSSSPYPGKPEVADRPDEYVGTPGFKAKRLPLTTSLMPTALTWTEEGQLVVASLKGNLYAAKDTDGDGLEDQLQQLQEGLSAPFGLHAQGDDLLVSHKPEVLTIRNFLSDPPALEVAADGWGHSENYHDWVSGFAHDADGNLLISTGSDYSQGKRPRELTKWRGDVLKLTPGGDSGKKLEQVAVGLRYPMGIASDGKGRIFTTDQQGVQNCFNEINHIVQDGFYGVPGQRSANGAEKRAAIQMPHPWTRSVNGLFFIPEEGDLGGLNPFRGHGVGCEYNNRFLVRFSLQEVGGELQGACYELTKPAGDLPNDADVFLGPINGAISPEGRIYIGNIHDSGWLGGQNTGEISCLTPQAKMPNGIREVRATSSGFEIELLEPVTDEGLTKAENYDLSGYTKVYEGGYATPESGRYRPEITLIERAEEGKVIRLTVEELRPRYVYDLHLSEGFGLFPRSAYYTMNRVPGER